MTMLLEYNQVYLDDCGPEFGQVYTKDEPTFEQVEFFVNIVKPRLLAAEFTLGVCTENPRITMGDE